MNNLQNLTPQEMEYLGILLQKANADIPNYQLPQPKAVVKKKKAPGKPRTKLTSEQKMWVIIAVASFLSLLVVKNWFTNVATPTPKRVEQKRILLKSPANATRGDKERSDG